MTDLTPDQVERRNLIAQLFGAFGRTPKEHEFSGYETSLKLMPTASLARVVSTWLEQIGDATDPEDLRVPTAAKLWALRRKLKKLPEPRPALELHGAPAQAQDAWDTAANSHLLNYITRGLVEKTIHGIKAARDANCYAPDSRFDAAKRCAVPGPETIARTAILTKWKNVWARDMREDRELYDGKLDGKRAWADCMAKAEAEIDALIAAERAAA
jgi:hypothetical protein